jgi:predicted acetyltransferase
MNISEKNPILIDPALELDGAYHAFIHEFWRAGEAKNAPPLPKGDFSAFIEKLNSEARGELIASGWVPQNTYWLVVDGEILGESHLRHSLTPMLEILGGHIGYRIRPSMRRQGLGKQILALTMRKARSFGLPRLLLTCDTNNTASARIIENNGGVLRDRIFYQPRGVEVSRYWIDLTQPSVQLSIPAANAVAISAHQASYPNALLVKAGEELELGKRDPASPGWIWCTNKEGESGWMPLRWLDQMETAGTALRDYSSVELTLQTDEEVSLHLEEGSWFWATNRVGQSGWVPVRSIMPLESKLFRKGKDGIFDEV